MDYESHKFQRYKDPFLVQPLPKSFYHPSPSKDVDEQEAIKSPQRRNEPTTRCAQEEEFLRENPTFHTSALPNVRTLGAGSRSGQLGQGDAVYNETWPDSERSLSVSVSRNTSNVTSTTDDSEAANPSINIADIVTGLERLKHHQNSIEPQEEKLINNAAIGDGGESVLKRYIDRFRNSAPKPREERMKEKGDNQQFWWLRLSSGSRPTSVEADREKNLQQHEATPESGLAPKLTKEALLALDYESYHLQSKADRLLSKSELSLASSGPLVSTEGLGSDTSVSSSFARDSHPKHQPAFVKAQESFHRLGSKPLARKEEKPGLFPVTSKSPANDILAQWRLRRKIEEAGVAPSARNLDRFTNVKPPRHTELDSRLEEFRKKILSQKALVTHEDIHYERQRLNMLMDDVKQDGGSLDKEIIQTQTAIQELEAKKDTILERLQKITHSIVSSKMTVTESIPQNVEQSRTLSSLPFSISDDHNFSINNANFGDRRVIRSSEQTTTLNKNNTASSNNQIPENEYINDEHEFVVDHFESQEVCDPKKRGFFIGSSKTESKGSRRDIVDGSADTEPNTGRRKAEIEVPIQNQTTENVQEFTSYTSHDSQNEERKVANIQCNDNSPNIKIFSLKESQGNAKSNEPVINGNNGCLSKEGNKSVDTIQKHANKRINENFYQYLKAEKPISENKKSKIKDKTIASDKKSECFTDKESRENLRSHTTPVKSADDGEHSGDSKRHAKEQEKSRRRTKMMSVKDKDGEHAECAGSEVLADITNESNHLLGKLKGKSVHKSEPNQNLKFYSGNISKKSGPVEIASASSPRSHSASSRSSSSSSGHQPVQHAIGQTVADHLFDGSVLISSVDSWASMFPQSPGMSRSLCASGYSAASPASSQADNTPLESTPTVKASSAESDEEYVSDGEFYDDPLLQILRQQRDHHLQQLQWIEVKLQSMDT